MKTLAPLLLAAALASSSAWAQLPPIIVSNQAYVPLTTGTQVTGLNGDDQGVLVPLGFTFPFLGQNYTHVMLTTNGAVIPGVSTTTTCGVSPACRTNASMPSASTPQPVLAAWWDDLNLGSGGGMVRTQLSPGQFTVEYFNAPRFLSAASTVTVQIKLTAAGSVTFHYGSLVTGAGVTWSASAGFQNAGGTLGANLLGCTSSCGAANFPASGTLFTIGEPNQADLAVSSVAVTNFVTQPDDNVSFTVNANLRNFGRLPANNFLWRAYLSRDQQLDLDGGVDLQVAEGGPESLPAVFNGTLPDGGLSTVAVTANVLTTTPPPTGEYYVLVFADPTGVVAEASEGNNVSTTSTTFLQGPDPVATSISGPATTVGLAVESFPISFRNRGTAPATNVGFRILLSADQLLDQGDFPLFTGTRTVAAGAVLAETVAVTIPANAPNGNFFYLLQLDPAGILVEATETNNVVVSTGKVDVRRADLIAESVSFVDTVTGLETATARFGEAVRLKVRFHNGGQADATNFRVALVLSGDTSLSLLSDTYVCASARLTSVPSVITTEVLLDCTLPLQNAANMAFGTGPYFLFGVVDSTGAVFETNKANNSLMLGPIRITQPGADLTVTALAAPASGGVGEIIPVVRTLRNIGNVDAPAVAYRYYASANDIITSDDVLLPIVSGGQMLDENMITLARGTGDTATDLVHLPGTMPAGTYYVGCLIDPANTVSGELNLLNNALASRSMVVAPSSLRVVNTALPDAVVGRPYTFRLSAVGEQGPSTWRIDPLLGSAPSWLSIGASDGLLTGTPTGSGGAEVVGLTVVLENAGRQSAVRLALRVLPTTSGLEITSSSLPAMVNSTMSQYLYALGAAGGVRPYTWRIAGGALPMGVSLTSDGVLLGAPRNVASGAFPLNMEVRDAVGGRANRTLSLRIIAAGAISFRTVFIPDALVGQDYLQDIAVANQDGSSLAKPLTWRVTGAVPAGLSVTPQAELITVGGRATESGTFSFTLSVEDNNGRSDSLEFTMTVHPPRYRVTGNFPESVHPAEVVSLQLGVTPMGNVTYRLVSGVLPPGLTLDSTGLISGTVAIDRSEGQWAFVVEARDAAGMTGLTPLSLRVAREVRGPGCTTVPTAPLLFLLFSLSRRRERVRVRENLKP